MENSSAANSTPTASCPAMLEFTDPESGWAKSLVPLLSFGLAISVSAIVCLVFQFFILFPKGAIHSDYRAFFLAGNLANFLDSIIVLGNIVYHIIGVVDPGKILGVSTEKSCIRIGLFRSFFRSFVIFLLFVTGIERMFVVRRKRFMDPSRVTRNGALILGISAVIPACSLIPAMLVDWRTEPCYCLTGILSSGNERRFVSYFIVLLVSTLSLGLHLEAWRRTKEVYKNFHLSTTKHSLAERFSIASNVKLEKLLQVLVGTHMATDTFFSLDSILLSLYNPSTLSHEYYLFNQALNYVFIVIQRLSQCLLMNYVHDTYRKRLLKLLHINPVSVTPKKIADSLLKNAQKRYE